MVAMDTKTSKRFASLHVMGPATDRSYTAPPPDLTRDTLREIEREG